MLAGTNTAVCSRMHTMAKRCWFPLVLSLLGLGVALAVVRPWGNFPLNDDWVYAKDVTTSLANGRFTITGFESAWGLPQTLLGMLLTLAGGFSHTLLRTVGWGSAAGCAIVLVLLLDGQGATVAQMTVAALSFLFFTPVLLLANSFMTDLPFTLLWLAAVFLFERAWSLHSARTLACATAFGLLAAIQRQLGIFLLFAAAIWLLPAFGLRAGSGSLPVWRGFRTTRRYAAVGLLGLMVAAIGVGVVSWWWSRHGAAYSPPLEIRWDPGRLFRTLHKETLYLGWAVLPLIPLVRFASLGRASTWGRWWTMRRGKAGVSIYVLLSVYFIIRTVGLGLDGHFMPYLSNQVSRFGVFGYQVVLSGVRPEILGGAVGWALTLASLGSGLALLACLLQLYLREAGDEPGPADTSSCRWGRFTFLSAAFYIGFVSLHNPLFDRYLVPIIPAVFMLICRPGAATSALRVALAGVLTVTVALFSISITADYFRWNDAKWTAAQYALAHSCELDLGRKLEPSDIHAGYEWHGWFQSEHTSHPPVDPADFPVVVSYSTLPGYTVWKTFPYDSWWAPCHRAMFLLSNPRLVHFRQAAKVN